MLLLGVVRRIREHDAKLATASGAPEVMAPVGHRVGAFAATAVDGRSVARDALVGPTLVGFLSPQCQACHERLDDFKRAAAAHADGHAAEGQAGAALAVVVRDGGDTDELVRALDGTAAVVVEDIGGPLTQAFSVQGFPAFALLGPDGTIQASGYQLPLVES